MNLKKDLDELLQAGVVSEEIAERIRKYYREKPDSSNHRLIMIFGILGALISGLGVILIMAYNWDEFSEVTKSVLAFVPLLIGQTSALYTLLRRPGDSVWRESSSIAVILGLGACLFLISQIYQYPGTSESLLLVWLWLILPVSYLMNSAMASLIYLTGITFHSVLSTYFGPSGSDIWIFWLQLAGILPYLYYLAKHRSDHYLTIIHQRILPILIAIVLGGFADGHGIWMYIAYFSLFGMFFLLGQISPFSSRHKFLNGFQLAGRTGTVIMLILVSFRWFWKEVADRLDFGTEVFTSSAFLIAVILTVIAFGLLLYVQKRSGSLKNEPYAYIFLIFIPCFFSGKYSMMPLAVINLMLLLLGIWTIRASGKEEDFTELNFGLLIFTVLIFSRFFDQNISFLVRGFIFIVVGLGFFLANYRMYRKKTANGS